MIGNKIAEAVAKSYDDKIAKVSRRSPQNNSERIINEHDKEIPKERSYLRKKYRKLLII